MTKVRTEAQLRQALQKAVDSGIENSRKPLEDFTKQTIDQVVYGAGSPAMYGRTYNLKESIVAQPQGSMSIKIKHQSLGGYYSMSGVSLSTEAMANIVTSGASPVPFGSGFWTSPRPYMEVTAQQLAGGEWKAILTKGIASAGYKVR